MTDHILIGGVPGSGKSFLLQRLIEAADLKVGGFMTELDRSQKDENGMYPLYIYPSSMPVSERTRTADNLLGACAGRDRHKAYTERFDTLAVKMLRDVAPDEILVMDEIGFLESEAEHFKEEVFKAFNRPGPILAVIKERYDVPFLEDIRNLPDTIFFRVTPENREQIFEDILEIVKSWK